MLKRIGFIVAMLAVCALTVHADISPATLDHCTTGLKQQVAFDINSATTTSLIAPVTGANVYICGMTFNAAAGTGTFALEYGTGATCGGGGGATLMMGPITDNTAAPNTLIVIPNSGYTQWMTSTTTPATVVSQRICALTTGTIHQSGSLTFVQE